MATQPRSKRYRWGVKYRSDEEYVFAAFIARGDADAFVAFDNNPELLEVIEL